MKGYYQSGMEYNWIPQREVGRKIKRFRQFLGYKTRDKIKVCHRGTCKITNLGKELAKKLTDEQKFYCLFDEDAFRWYWC